MILTGGAVGGVPEVEGSGQLTGTTLNRVVAAAELYHRKRPPVLVSGGQVFTDTGNEGRLSKRKRLLSGCRSRTFCWMIRAERRRKTPKIR
ncbi:YdcF family protein [Paenibacillus sp. P26]|nr:YdcF family protein [Paenibacillus sp. P26]